MPLDPAIAFGASHQGDRDYQEDCFDVADMRGQGDGADLLIVCDGMGGHVNGAEAARLAVDGFVHAVRDGAARSPAERLDAGLDEANEAIGRSVAASREKSGMGCTLAAVILEGGRAHWISVGDSPIWLIRGGRLERLNDDHSVGGQYAALVARGEMSQSEVEERGGLNQLRSAVMGERLGLIDRAGAAEGIRLRPGDMLLVASDGILTLSPEEIAATSVAGKPADSIVHDLIDAVLACRRPRQDNITAVAYRHSAPSMDAASSDAPATPPVRGEPATAPTPTPAAPREQSRRRRSRHYTVSIVILSLVLLVAALAAASLWLDPQQRLASLLGIG